MRDILLDWLMFIREKVVKSLFVFDISVSVLIIVVCIYILSLCLLLDVCFVGGVYSGLYNPAFECRGKCVYLHQI